MPGFVKLTAAGNDFVLLDGREPLLRPPSELARELCPRRLAVGADGLLVVAPTGEGGYELTHYEPDGNRTFCLNGCRAASAWLVGSGVAPADAKLRLRSEGVELVARAHGAADRWDVAALVPSPERLEPCQVALPEGVLVHGTFVDVGNPQLVVVLEQLEQLESHGLMQRARSLRWSAAFPEGTNVSFVAPTEEEGTWRIRTYERGVEGETLACGTGVLAAAATLLRTPEHAVMAAGRPAATARRLPVLGPGGEGLAPPCTITFLTRAGEKLEVTFPAGAESSRVWASGPVRLVAKGETWG